MDKSKVIDIIKNKVDKEIAVTEETDITDLGFNSYDLVSMVCEIEDEYDIEITDSEVSEINQVKDIFNYVNNDD